MSEDFLALHPLIDALGWTLIHFVWQGALFGLLFAALMKTTASSSASARHAMAVSVLVLLGLAPIVTFTLLALGYTTPAKLLVTPVAVSGWWIDVESMLKGLLPWAVLAWLFGVVGLSGRLTLDWMAVRRLASYCTKPLSAELEQLATRVRRAYQVAVHVRVLESAIVNVPLAVGWLKPVILIPPSALMGLTPRQLELILAHEFAHIRRYDHLINLFQVILETLLFYHPVVRWVSNRVRVERENCCDDLVVAHTGDSVAYARALTELEGLRNVSPQLAIAATDGQLLHRVNRLVAQRDPQRGSVAWAASLFLVLINLSVLTGTQMALDGVDEPGQLSAEVAGEQPRVIRPAQVMGGRVALASTASIPAPVLLESMLEPQYVPAAAFTERREAASPREEDIGKPMPKSTAELVETASQERVPAPQPTEEAVARAAPAPGDAERPVVKDEPEGGIHSVDVEARSDSLSAAQTDPLNLDDVLYEVLRRETSSSQDALSESYTGGELVRGKPPAFPRKARRLPSGGWVVARFTVDREGRVEELDIVESRPSGVFEKAVTKAVSKWRFRPYELDGEAVARTVTQAFRFELGPTQVADASEGNCQVVTGSRLCRPAGQSIKIIYFARR